MLTERPGDLWHAAVEDLREGPTAVVEGPFADSKCGSFTAADIRFKTKGPVVYAVALAAWSVIPWNLAPPGPGARSPQPKRAGPQAG